MRSRFSPYAVTPGRLVAQLFSDITVTVWTMVWLLIGLAVHAAIATIAGAGRQVESGADGIAGSLESAGHSADRVPLVGDAFSKPFTAASHAALDIAGAGHTLDSTASWLAVLLAIAVAAPPIAAVVVPWLVLRLRFFRRKRMVLTLSTTPAGEQLLALRALANRPLAKLTTVGADPAGAWRHGDPAVIHRLVTLELRSAGFRRTVLR